MTTAERMMPPVGATPREQRTSRPPGGHFVRFLTSLQRRIFNSTSGLALLWVGWVVMVFHAVLWFMTGESNPDMRHWQSFVVMALLAQSAIVTGIGLAVVDVVSARPQQRTGAAKQAARAANPGPLPPTPPPAHVAAMPPFPMARVSGRSARLYPDGSIEIETKLGRRRFPSAADAIKFVGPSAVTASALH